MEVKEEADLLVKDEQKGNGDDEEEKK